MFLLPPFIIMLSTSLVPVTITVMLWDLPPAETVIVVFPTPTAVSNPALLIVAIELLPELQETEAVLWGGTIV